MTFEHNHKTIVYIILGIVVIFALGVYIYITLSNAQQAVPAPTVATSTAQQITMQRRALLEPFTPTNLSAKERNSQQALVTKY